MNNGAASILNFEFDAQKLDVGKIFVLDSLNIDMSVKLQKRLIEARCLWSKISR